jgi:hypothetical protein
VRLTPRSRRAVVAAFAALAMACASSNKRPSARADLLPARNAVEEARKAGAPEHAPEAFKRATESLALAEASNRTADGQSQRHVDVTVAEARGATAVARLAAEMKRAGVAPGATGDRSLSARIRRLEEEQRRLEDRIELLQRDLEVTETELIRSKARLKGNETKAEASAAVAEAQILVNRLAEDRSKASTLARSRESLAKAEEQLGLGNFGAAIFFALKAQDTATRTQDTAR